MARKIEEELIGYQFVVRQVEVPLLDEKGNPVFNGGTGGPKMVPNWIIDLIGQTPFEVHVVHVSFNKDGKQKLVEALTGGITVASQLGGQVEL